MTKREADIESAYVAKRILSLKAQPTTLRRCLCCDFWMRSTGPDHRLCNPCNGKPDYTGSLVGKRVLVAGRRKGVTV